MIGGRCRPGAVTDGRPLRGAQKAQLAVGRMLKYWAEIVNDPNTTR